VNTGHAAPILAALKADDTGALTTSDGAVPQGTLPPYRVVYTSVTTPEAIGMEDAADRVTCTAIVHNVAENAEAARVIADRTAAALIGLRPVVDGRDCARIRQIDSAPQRRDESAIAVTVTQTDVYQYVSLPV
jgi:hypothetical protein